MLPYNAEAVKIGGLFKGEGPSFSQHSSRIPVKTKMSSDNGPGVNRSQFKNKFKSSHSVQNEPENNDENYISFWYVFGNRKEAVPEVKKGFSWVGFPQRSSSNMVDC